MEDATFFIGAFGCAGNAISRAFSFQPAVMAARPLIGEPHDPFAVSRCSGSNCSGTISYEGPDFFSAEDRYTRGVNWYTAHFELAGHSSSGISGSKHHLVDGSQRYLSSPYCMPLRGFGQHLCNT